MHNDAKTFLTALNNLIRQQRSIQQHEDCIKKDNGGLYLKKLDYLLEII